MDFLCTAISHRKESLNKLLIEFVSAELKRQGYFAENVPFEDFDAPLFKGIIDEAACPAGIQLFREKMHAAKGVIFSVPEYNYSIPGVFKNLIDWVSCFKPNAFNKKPILLLCATPSERGGRGGLWSTRAPLDYLHAYVFPQIFGLAKANLILERKEGTTLFKDQELEDRLLKLIEEFVIYSKSLQN